MKVSIAAFPTAALAAAGLAASLVGSLAGCAAGPSQSQGAGPLAFGEPIRRPLVDALLLLDFDADRDRRLVISEVTASAASIFASADSNSDDALGAIELRAWALAAAGNAEAAPLLAAIDRNGDGVVRAEEFTRYYADRVASLDADKDGAASRAELVEEIAAPTRPRPKVLTTP